MATTSAPAPVVLAVMTLLLLLGFLLVPVPGPEPEAEDPLSSTSPPEELVLLPPFVTVPVLPPTAGMLLASLCSTLLGKAALSLRKSLPVRGC